MKSIQAVLLAAAVVVVAGTGAAVVDAYGGIGGTANVYPAIEITEVMANPSNDTGEEYVEVYNPSNADIDLKDWTVADDTDKNQDLLDGYNDSSATIPSQSYAVITDADTSLSVSVTHLSTGDDAIGDGLGNDGETVYLLHSDGEDIDQVTYPGNCSESASYQKTSGGWGCASPTQGGAQ